MDHTAASIMASAEAHLETARFGLTDLKGKPERRRAGLMNAIVFGRSATFALQNLRGVVPNFDDWYQTKQAEMKADPLMKFFNETRRKVEHEAHVPGKSAVHINKLTSQSLRDLEPRPPGAVSFFMGDELGGAGWEVKLPDGSKEKYYVDLPDHVGKAFLALDAPGYEHLPAQDAVAVYLDRIEAIIREAREKFIQTTE